MKNSIYTASVLALLAVGSVQANALQPKSLGMAGVGVAVGDVDSAVSSNPALLSSSRLDASFSLVLPSIGLGVKDPDDFRTSVEDFQDANHIDALKESIDAAGMPGSFALVGQNALELSRELETLSGKQVDLNVGAMGAIALPGQSFGFALVAKADMNVSGVVNYRDGDKLSGLAADLQGFDECVEANLVSLGSCLPSDRVWRYIDPSTGAVLFDPDEDLESNVHVRGYAQAEVGVAMSTSFEVYDQRVSVGVTPKFVHVRVIDYVADVDTADVNDINETDYVAQYNDFNADVGVLLELGDSWTVGAAVNNVFSREYAAENFGVPTGYVAKIEPEAKVGFAYDNGWFVWSVEGDATTFKKADGRLQRFVSTGVEVNAWDVAQVRFGYKHDLEETSDPQVSVGVGLSPFGLHVDLGVLGNEEQIQAGVQLGFKW